MNTPFLTDASSGIASAAIAPRTDRANAGARSHSRSRVAEAAYIAFLVLIFVGVSPFAVPGGTVGVDPAASGAGDFVRQICYLTVFGVLVSTAVTQRGWRAFSAIPLLLAVLLLWCALSTSWSLDPAVTFRRAVLVSVVAVSAFLAVEMIGARRSLQLLGYVLAGIVILNWVSLFLIPQAKHFANDAEPGVAGDWRGLYVHKNITGALCANSAIIFLYSAIKTRRLSNLLLCLAALGFLIGTASKSSIALLPLAVMAGCLYRFAARNRLDRRIIWLASALLVFVATVAICAWWDAITPMLQDPRLFTGRVAIWQAEIAFILGHPMLGSGFGTFAYTGDNSPIYQYINSPWVGTVANGHQGYLELLVTLGIPGFCLAMLCLFVGPAMQFAAINRIDLDLRALLFTLFTFFLMHNFMETNFLRADGVEWVTFLLVLAMLRTSVARKTAII